MIVEKKWVGAEGSVLNILAGDHVVGVVREIRVNVAGKELGHEVKMK
jgi:hypothetical protein